MGLSSVTIYISHKLCIFDRYLFSLVMPTRLRQDRNERHQIKSINDRLANALYRQEIDDLIAHKENPNTPDSYLSRYNPKTTMPFVAHSELSTASTEMHSHLRLVNNRRMEQLEEIRSTDMSDSPFDFLLKQLISWTQHCTMEASEDDCVLRRTPSYLSGELRPYQIYGVNWLHTLFSNGVNGILADEMGLGKTFQSIAFLGTLKFERKISGPHLVLCPLSVLGNWKKEFRAWCPSLRVYRFHARSDIRGDMVEAVLMPLARGEPSPYDVIITTYEMYLAELRVFSRIKWTVLLLDEAHRIKNEESSLTTCMKKINSTARFLVTGTPLQNNLRELYSLLHFIIPSVFRDGDCFDSWFDVSTGDGDAGVVSRLYEILRPVMLRRLKSEVSTNIPPKKEIYVECQLTKAQRDMYLEILSKNYSIINEGGGSKSALSNILMNLRKCCNHPYLFDGVEDGPPFVTNEKIINICGKMSILDRILKRLHEEKADPPNKVLIFSQMTRVLDIIEDYCQFRGYSFGRIDGSTSASDREKGMRLFNDFSNDMFVFLLSTRAGGLGINLQAANYVILYDSDWNPQQDLQAQDRAHRLGQKRPVTVLRFISGGTVEERIYTRALKKLYLDAMVVQKGRLKAENGEPESKDLLGTIRFGVEAMFKSKDKPLQQEDLDVLLNRGEEKMKEYQHNLIKTQETTLANYDAGITDTNLYEFEGINFSNDISTNAIIIEGINASVDKKQISDACELCNVFPTEIILNPDRTSAIIRCKAVNDAKLIKVKIDKIGACNQIRTQFISRDALITTEMLPEEAEAAQEEYGRGMRKRGFNPELKDEETNVKPKAPKLPKKPKLPDFRPHHLVPPSVIEKLHQFYERETLHAVGKWKHEEAQKRAIGAGKTISAELGDEYPENALSEAEQTEKGNLLKRAYCFFNWTAAETKNLFELMLSEGKDNVDRICEQFLGSHSVTETKAYLDAFWADGSECYPSNIWKFKMQQFRKAEERAEQVQSIREIFANNAEEYIASAGDTYTAALEKRLIELVHENGYDNIEEITRRLKLLPEYKFDFYVLTRSSQQIRRELSALLRKLQRRSMTNC